MLGIGTLPMWSVIHPPLPYLISPPPSREKWQMTVWEIWLFFHKKTCFSCSWRSDNHHHNNRILNRRLDFTVSGITGLYLGSGTWSSLLTLWHSNKEKSHYILSPKWHKRKYKQICFPHGSLHSEDHCSLGTPTNTHPAVLDLLAHPQFIGVKSQQWCRHPLGDFPFGCTELFPDVPHVARFKVIRHGENFADIPFHLWEK